MGRRRFLASTGTVIAAGIAGCAGGQGAGMGGASTTEGGDGTTMRGGDGTTTAASGASIGEHVAASDLEEQPVLGELGGNVIVAFEDPSCPRCRAFETDTVPNPVEPRRHRAGGVRRPELPGGLHQRLPGRPLEK